MRHIVYNLYDKLKEDILTINSIEDLMKIYNMDKVHIKTMLIELRRDIIYDGNELEFYIVKLIDNLVGEFEVNQSSFEIYELYLKGISRDYICKKNRINIYIYVASLKKVYAHLYLYDKEQNVEDLIKLKQEIVIAEEELYSRVYANHKDRIIYHDSTNALFGKNAKKLVRSNSIIRNIFEMEPQNHYRFIAISDTHFGHLNENLQYLDLVYNYASKHGIKYILHGGDVIEGSICNYRNCKEEYANSGAQIEHVMRDYLFDYGINNIVLLGNHDSSILISEGNDLFDALSEREDFVVLGYKQGFIKCNKEYISLKHYLPKMYNPCKEEEVLLNLSGHSHSYYVTHSINSTNVKIPTLSDVSPGILTHTGFLDIELSFSKGYANSVNVQFIPIDEKQYIRKLTK